MTWVNTMAKDGRDVLELLRKKVGRDSQHPFDGAAHGYMGREEELFQTMFS